MPPGRLKSVPRQGWVDRGIPGGESVADHTFRAMIMAWVLGDEAGLDGGRLLKLMLLHDLPEVEVGDLTPYASVHGELDPSEVAQRWRELVSSADLARGKREKRRAEERAVESLRGHLPPALGEELAELWLDYTERRSPEAKFAAQIDKLEAALQAVEYRAAGHDADVENFLQTARDVVEHPILVALLREIEAAARLDWDS